MSDEVSENQETPNPDAAAWIPHVVPFVAWIFLMSMLDGVLSSGPKYAVRTFLCAGLLIYFKPWRWYPRIQLKHLPLGIGVGILVCGFWILFETDYMSRFESIHKFYLSFGTLMKPWELILPVEHITYDPEQIGWPLTMTRLLGSAIVIAIIEEFFWRGWMYRWIIKDDFLEIDHGVLDWKAMLLTSLMFASVHQRWLVAFACGICYGLLYVRTRCVWTAAVAHFVTNLLLGIYVLWAGKYEFWV